MDTNADGKVTAAEMNVSEAAQAKRSASGGKERVTRPIDVMDANGDGVLSADEYASGTKAKFDAWDTN